MSLSMNVPTWNNAGVSPSEEKKQEGYAAGECLPAQHLNWFINQAFSNLAEVKTFINNMENKMPFRIIVGAYTGTGYYYSDLYPYGSCGDNTQKLSEVIHKNYINEYDEEDLKINIGATPTAVLITGDYAEESNSASDGATFIITDGYTAGNSIGDKTFTISAYSYADTTSNKTTVKYTAETEGALEVVSDTTTPTDGQIKIGDVLSVGIGAYSSSSSQKHLYLRPDTSLSVGDYVVFYSSVKGRISIRNQVRIVNDGFSVNAHMFNAAGKKYAYVALVNC